MMKEFESTIPRIHMNGWKSFDSKEFQWQQQQHQQLLHFSSKVREKSHYGPYALKSVQFWLWLENE